MSVRVGFTISNKDIKQIHEVLNDWYWLKLPTAYIEGLLKKNLWLAVNIKVNGASDTPSREYLIDAISEDLIGGDAYWPCNMTDREVARKYFNDLKKACDKRGFVFAG